MHFRKMSRLLVDEFQIFAWRGGGCLSMQKFETHPPYLITFGIKVYFAPEETIGEDEVNDGKHHANAPPDQSHCLTILRSRRVVDCQAVRGGDRWKDSRIQAHGCAG